MPLTRNTKETILGGYEEAMASAEHAFVVGFKGITVNQVNDLRNRVRKYGGQYEVIKHPLARLGKLDGGSAGDGRLAHAALPGEEEEARRKIEEFHGTLRLSSTCCRSSSSRWAQPRWRGP